MLKKISNWLSKNEISHVDLQDMGCYFSYSVKILYDDRDKEDRVLAELLKLLLEKDNSIALLCLKYAIHDVKGNNLHRVNLLLDYVSKSKKINLYQIRVPSIRRYGVEYFEFINLWYTRNFSPKRRDVIRMTRIFSSMETSDWRYIPDEIYSYVRTAYIYFERTILKHRVRAMVERYPLTPEELNYLSIDNCTA